MACEREINPVVAGMSCTWASLAPPRSGTNEGDSKVSAKSSARTELGFLMSQPTQGGHCQGHTGDMPGKAVACDTENLSIQS